MVQNPNELVDSLITLFPNGPPDDDVMDMVMSLTPDGYFGKDAATIDTDDQFLTTTPSGTEVGAKRRSRNEWTVRISSPPSPNGRHVQFTHTVTGDKAHAVAHIGEIAGDMIDIKQRLRRALYAFDPHDGSVIDVPNIPPSLVPMLQTYQWPNELAFDVLYQEMSVADKKDKMLNMDFLGLNPDTALNVNKVEIGILCAIGLHELWISRWNKQFLEEIEMAKNSPGDVWWEITGGVKGIRKITNSLNHNTHFMVLDTKEQIYLNIAGSEWKFVQELATGLNCRARKVDEPNWNETICGKKSTNPVFHQRNCNSCKRVRTNQPTIEVIEDAPPYVVEAVPDDPPAVQPSTDPRSGPVITVQGPSFHEADDYAALASDNRRTADELMVKAEYYTQVADYYDALLQPTDAVAEAQALLDKAKADEDADRERQRSELDALIASGPPA